MPSRQEVPVNSEILRWARKQANFSISQAALSAKIHDLKSSNISAEDRLTAWENEKGSERPTLNELKSIAKAYRRPLLTFFLSEPPKPSSKLDDFRTFGDHPITESTPEFSAFMRRIEVLQQEVRDILVEEGAPPLAFIGSASTKATPQEIAQSIRDVLKFPFNTQAAIKNKDSLFNSLRNKAEDAGIFILKAADLGSHHSRISVKEFRGLTISDNYAPFIVVNPNDALSALLFTLVHEFAHLWLGDSGISNDDILSISPIKRQEREIICNQVSAEFLVPKYKLLEEFASRERWNLRDAIDYLSDIFKVSSLVIGRRLFELDKMDEETYWQLYEESKQLWADYRSSLSESEGGPGYFTNTKSKLGNKLLKTIIGAAYDGRLPYTDASRMLNIKVNNFSEFMVA